MPKRTPGDLFRQIPDMVLGPLVLDVIRAKKNEGRYKKDSSAAEILTMLSALTKDPQWSLKNFEILVMHEAAIRYASDLPTGIVCENLLKSLLTRLLRYSRMLKSKAPEVLLINECGLSREALASLDNLFYTMMQDMKDNCLRNIAESSPCYFCAHIRNYEGDEEPTEAWPKCTQKQDMSDDSITDRGTEGCPHFERGGVMPMGYIEDEKESVILQYSKQSLQEALFVLGTLLRTDYKHSGAECFFCKAEEPTTEKRYCQRCGRLLTYHEPL